MKFGLDGTLVKLKLEGEKFESSLPGSLIVGLAQYQEKIYRVYQANRYGLNTRRKLTPEESRLFEINVTVKQGSTEIWIKMMADALGEVIRTMPADKIPFVAITVTGIIAVACCIKGVGSVAVKQAFKTKRKALADKKAISKNELEKKKFEFLESTVNTVIEAMRAVSAGIVESGPGKVKIDGKTVTTESIASIAEDLIPEKPETIEDQSVITGTYRIQRVTLDFKNDSASADIFDVESGDTIRGLVVQPKHLSDGSYRVLKTAQDQHDVKLQLIVTKRNDRIHKAVLDKIL